MIRRILTAAAALLLASCSHRVSVIDEHVAPDGRHRAVVFTSHGGGAASDLHTSVSIVGARRRTPGWPPNTFTALHHDPGSPQEGRFGGPKITVRWTGPAELEIAYDPRASTLRRHTQVAGVRVVYRAAEQENTPFRGRRQNEKGLTQSRRSQRSFLAAAARLPRLSTAWRPGRRGTSRRGLPGTAEGWKRGRGP